IVAMCSAVSGASSGPVNTPCDVARAPAGVGRSSGRMVAGKFGDGRIDPVDQVSGGPAGQGCSERGGGLPLEGLWAPRVGRAGRGGASTLQFSAGLNDEWDGRGGSINPVK